MPTGWAHSSCSFRPSSFSISAPVLDYGCVLSCLLWESSPQNAVEQEARLKVGSGGRILDCAHPIAQVELPGALFDRPEQPLQASPQIRSFADVGFGLGVRCPQKKHRRRCRDGGENLRIPLRREFQALGQHSIILVCERPGEHSGRTSFATDVHGFTRIDQRMEIDRLHTAREFHRKLALFTRSR